MCVASHRVTVALVLVIVFSTRGVSRVGACVGVFVCVRLFQEGEWQLVAGGRCSQHDFRGVLRQPAGVLH